MNRLYVYALADRAAAPFRKDGHTIEFAQVGGVYAAIERLSERPPISEAALRTQHAIVSTIAQKADAVLPARFGSFVEGAELQRVIERRGEAVHRALDLVRGRVQMTVRVPDVVAEGADARRVSVGARPTVTHRSRPAPRSRPGTQYLEERKAAASPRLPPEIVAAINAAVEAISAAARAEPGSGRTRATFYHLIDRGAQGEYREAMTAAERHVTGYVLAVSGPWAPFAFAPELWT